MKSRGTKLTFPEANWSILSALNSYSIKSAVALDFRQLLQYSLCPASLSICTDDRSRRRTNKSKLKKVLLIYFDSLDKLIFASFPKDVLLIDLISLINTMIFELPSTYEEFAQKLMQHIMKNYKRADLLVDYYKANSLK